MENQIEKTEKLDNFSKVLIATASINYMASMVNSVNHDYTQIIHTLPESEADDISLDVTLSVNAIKDGIESQNEVMTELVKKLSSIVEDMANFVNGVDMNTPIDGRILNPACEILLLGKDDVTN